MNSSKVCSTFSQLIRGLSSVQPNVLSSRTALPARALSTSVVRSTYQTPEANQDKNPYPVPQRWTLYNSVIREPVSEEEPTRRRATYHYVRDNVKYSPKKMWYICCLIRGLNVDEAIKQLSFIGCKGAQLAKEMLIEAQNEAVNKHGFEFKSNMFVAECFTGKGLVVKGVRKHAFYRMGFIRYFHHHFFLKLVEGEAPRPFYPQMNPSTGQGKLDKYFEDLRDRKIEHSI
jgi:large subunit ribosomal protein L22